MFTGVRNMKNVVLQLQEAQTLDVQEYIQFGIADEHKERIDRAFHHVYETKFLLEA